ncbi:PKD domain-containing protein [Alteromonas sp. P256]|uniref:PKD domain-containing protein n=1 Tax=Alteromonas sp. P256 TaxID=3117399 RepID=UPI002FE01025
MALEKFNYPDGTTSVPNITAASNNLVINDGKAYVSSPVSSNFFIFEDSVSNGVFEMYAEEPSESNKQYGFMARYVDIDNNWLITVSDGTSGRVRIIKKVNGSNTTVEENNREDVHNRNGNKLKLKVTDEEISFYVNDERVLSTKDQFLSGQGKTGFKIDDPSIAVNWMSYPTEEPVSLVHSGKALSATKLGQIVPLHSDMASIGLYSEYWPNVVRGDTIPNWPSTKYPLIMYTSPDHAPANVTTGIYVRVYNAELGEPTDTAAWEEWQNVSNRAEFDHIAKKTNPIFTESAAPSETPSVISSNGIVYLFTHNILNAGSGGNVNQGTSLAKGVNGIDFTSVASPLLSYDAYKEQGDMHTGYANIIKNPIPSQPYEFLVNATHGGGDPSRGPSEVIYGTNDLEDPEAYEIITMFDRSRHPEVIYSGATAGWGVTWVVMLHNISTLRKEGPYYRLSVNIRKDVVTGGDGIPVKPIEVLVDENFNIVSLPNRFVELGDNGTFDDGEITHYSEVEYEGRLYGFYRGKAQNNDTVIAMLDVAEIDYDWSIIHPLSNKTELLRVNSNNTSGMSATSNPTTNQDGLLEFPLNANGNSNVIDFGTFNLSDYDVLEVKFKRQAQTDVQDIYGEIGFFDDPSSPSNAARFIWTKNNGSLIFNVLSEGVANKEHDTRKTVGSYDRTQADDKREYYTSRIVYGIRIFPATRVVHVLGGVSVINEFTLENLDISQPLALAMNFSTPSGENTSMEVEEITVNSYSNAAREATTPTVNAGVNDAGMVGETVQLNGSASDYDSLLWECTSGQTPTFSDATILNPTVTFNEAGVYDLQLTATNAQGSTIDSVEFVINEEVDSTPPQITFVGGSTVNLLVGESYTPQVTVVDANDGTLTPTITNNVDTSTAGTYTVTATATDAAGNTGSATQTVIVEAVPVNQTPTANAGPDQSVAAATQFTLDGTGSQDTDGTIIEWRWTQTAGDTVMLDLSDPARPVGTSPSRSSSQTLTFELVTVDDEGAESNPGTVNINVAAVVLSEVLKVIERLDFDLVTQGDVNAYFGRANREVMKLKPSNPAGLALDADGFIMLNDNTIQEVKVIAEGSSISSNTDSINIEGSEMLVRLGDLEVSKSGNIYFSIIVFVDGDNKGVVVSSRSSSGNKPMSYVTL